MSWVGYLFALATFVYSLVCVFLDFQLLVTPYHAAVAGISGGLLVWVRFGEWAMSDQRQFYGRVNETYIFMVGQWWLCIALVWAGLADYCQIQRGQATIEDNWFVLQTQVLIPFTTELDSKRDFRTRSIQLLALSIVTAVLCLPAALDAWRALGGGLLLVRARFALMVAEMAPLLVLGGATAAYAVYAAEISAYATPDTTADLLWISAMAGLSMLAVALAAGALARWGSSYASHALLTILLPIPALVMFSTSLWVQSRAAEVAGFVQGNWATLRLYVPTQYSPEPWRNYATASSTPMLQAASLGLQLSVLCFFSALYHAWAAAAMHSVGEELAVAAAAHEREHARLMALALGEEEGSSSSSNSSSSSSGVSKGQSGRGLRTSRSLGYGTAGPVASPLLASDSSEEAAVEGEEEGAAAAAALPQPSSAYSSLPSTSSELFLTVDVALVASQKTRAAARAGASPEARALLDRLDAVDILRALPGRFAEELKGLGNRVDLPPLRTSFQLLRHDMVQLWGAHRVCIMVTLGVAFCGLMGLMGALIKVTSDGYCSRLVARQYGAATLNFTTSFPLWGGGAGNFPDVFNIDRPAMPSFFPDNPTGGRPSAISITHGYPLGSVEVLAVGPKEGDEFNGLISGGLPSAITVTAIFFGVDGKDLPSAASLRASLLVNGSYITGPCLDGFDPCAGYSSMSIVLNPPPAAAGKCLGVRLIVTIPALLVQLNITSASAAVNVTGNLASLNLLQPSIYAATVTSDKAPITFNSVYADYRSNIPLQVYLNNTLGPILTPGYVIQNYTAPLQMTPSIVGVSKSGSLAFRSVFAVGVLGRSSSGSVRFASVASLCIPGGYQGGDTPYAVCGSIEGHAGGYGILGISNLLAARNASFSSDKGLLVCANVAALVGTTLNLTSGTGKVYLSNLLQGAGEETTVTSGGAVSVAASFVNRLNIFTRGAAGVSFVALFLGIDSSSILSFELSPTVKLSEPLSKLFNPHLDAYALPKVTVSTDFGDVSALSIGGNPQSSSFADYVSVDFRSIDGAIKLEVNGGGINSNYTVSSGAALAVVEIDGNPAPLSGHLGTVGSGLNNIFLRSEKDNVQLSRECEKQARMGSARTFQCAPLTHTHISPHTCPLQFSLL